MNKRTLSETKHEAEVAARRAMSPEGYRAIRRAIGITQTELSGIIGINNMTISRRENGHVRITREAALAMACLYYQAQFSLED